MSVLHLQVRRKLPTVCIWMSVLPLQVGRKPWTACIGDCITFAVRRKPQAVCTGDCITLTGVEETTGYVYG